MQERQRSTPEIRPQRLSAFAVFCVLYIAPSSFRFQDCYCSILYENFFRYYDLFYFEVKFIYVKIENNTLILKNETLILKNETVNKFSVRIKIQSLGVLFLLDFLF